MMDRPMTTEELFNKIRDILKEKGRLPDILDYGFAINKPITIKNYEFELKNNLQYVDSEGIYLDLWIAYFVDEERLAGSLGTFKTLDSSNEAMHIMADFIIQAVSYVNRNQDEFTWEGADVRALDGNWKPSEWRHSCLALQHFPCKGACCNLLENSVDF